MLPKVAIERPEVGQELILCHLRRQQCLCLEAKAGICLEKVLGRRASGMGGTQVRSIPCCSAAAQQRAPLQGFRTDEQTAVSRSCVSAGSSFAWFSSQTLHTGPVMTALPHAYPGQ
jgi:hypothetical protein